MLVLPSIGAPNILNLYLNASTNSTPFFNVILSLPNVLVYTALCCLLFQIMGDLKKNYRTPVRLILEIKSPARSASTKQWVDIDFLRVLYSPTELLLLRRDKSRTNRTS